ncbi:hypothetical protein AcV5_008740 [Taiwanofungus camphoratus]|nr:hypothetical protein AcV5_008740 [Antrodia cinnamomea]
MVELRKLTKTFQPLWASDFRYTQQHQMLDSQIHSCSCMILCKRFGARSTQPKRTDSDTGPIYPQTRLPTAAASLFGHFGARKLSQYRVNKTDTP